MSELARGQKKRSPERTSLSVLCKVVSCFGK